jgi:TadE-like protein
MQTALHSNHTTPGTISRRARRPSRRRATVVLEFMVVLPILVIVLVGTVQFGVFYANMQQVALATRVGAEEASQTGGLALANDVPANVLLAISQQLETAGLTYCRVRLEHNVGGDQVELYYPSEDACGGGPDETLPADGLPREYVRLTVTVRLGEVMPDTIGCFCFSPAGADKTAFVTTIFRYELTPSS